MRPKGKLFALLAVFAAIGLVTASGAFTSVAADRTVTVNTAGDSSALLGLAPNSSGNGDYASTENGELTIDLSESNLNDINDGTGVNINATTRIDHVINVTNNGAQPVDFYVTTSGGGTGDADNFTVEFYEGADTSANLTNADSVSTSNANKTVIGSGSQTSVGIKLNTTGNVSNFNKTVTFNAVANETAS